MSWRFSTEQLVVCFVVAAFALYLVKYEVQDVREDVRVLQGDIASEQEAIALLHAEWAYLNRADRLQRLADKYLEYQVPSASVILGWDDVPHREQAVAVNVPDDGVR